MPPANAAGPHPALVPPVLSSDVEFGLSVSVFHMLLTARLLLIDLDAFAVESEAFRTKNAIRCMSGALVFLAAEGVSGTLVDMEVRAVSPDSSRAKEGTVKSVSCAVDCEDENLSGLGSSVNGAGDTSCVGVMDGGSFIHTTHQPRLVLLVRSYS